MISQRSWPWKVKIKGQNKWCLWIPWPYKDRSRHQNHDRMCFSSQIMVKDVFLQNGGEHNIHNAFAYVSLQTVQERIKQTIWRTMTLCDANYAMKEQLHLIVTCNNLTILPWIFIWYKLGLNTLSHYGDRAPVTLRQIGINCLVFQNKTEPSV